MTTLQTPLLSLNKPVVLVGLMGAGKSTIGRRLAHVLGMGFVDSDQEIVEAAGCSISDIFEIHGEAIFRDLEERIILKLLKRPPAVIATGGGAFINPQIRSEIQALGISVWLRADLSVLLERVARRDTRPLLKSGDKTEILSRLMQERYPIYHEAQLVIDSDEGAHETVVERIMTALKEQAHG